MKTWRILTRGYKHGKLVSFVSDECYLDRAEALKHEDNERTAAATQHNLDSDRDVWSTLAEDYIVIVGDVPFVHPEPDQS